MSLEGASGSTSPGPSHEDEAAVLRLAIRYDEDARAYRDVWGPVLLRPGRRLLQEFADVSVRTALDLGTGVGALTGPLVGLFPHATVLGCDRSEGMLALAPPERRFAVMDARRLGLAACSVDLVVSTFMLFHLEQPEEALREIHRILRPGGHLGTTTWASNLESVAIGTWNAALDELVPPDPGSPSSGEVEETDTPEGMAALLRRSGFTRIRSWSEEFAHTLDLENLVALRTRMGASRRRLATLEPRERTRFLRVVRGRLAALEPEAFDARGQVVYTTARRG